MGQITLVRNAKTNSNNNDRYINSLDIWAAKADLASARALRGIILPAIGNGQRSSSSSSEIVMNTETNVETQISVPKAGALTDREEISPNV